LGDDGEINGDLILHVSYDMYPQWLRIAIDEAERCAEAAEQVDKVWTDGSRPGEIDALERELRSGMQAIVAAAAAIDGFYGTVKDCCPVPDQIIESWRKSKLARAKQIAETFRRSFQIKQVTFNEIRSRLDELFTFRDEAIHPTGAAQMPVPHPRLKVATERRLTMYSAENAFTASKLALNIIALLLNHPKTKHQSLIEHCEAAKEWISPILRTWEAKNGQMFPGEHG
jgi:hypothetical protein